MINKKRVVVTGIGVFSNNGNNKEKFWRNNVKGISGIKPCSLFDTSKLRTPYVGQIEDDMPYLVNSPGEEGRIHYIIKKAIDEMLDDSGLKKEYLQTLEERAYLSFATSLAANNNIMGYVHDKTNQNINGEWLTTIPSFVDWIKEYCGVNGGCYTSMAACASGTTAAGIAVDLLQFNRADVVIVGGADPLTEFSCVGFHALKSLSHSICKPFDKNRDGISIGEAGAFFIFEELSHAKKRGAKIYGEIMGYGINNDAYHITSPSPDGCGALASMKMALSNAGITVDQVDYINAHGTGTELNDKMEAAAIYKMFGKNVVVSSTKSMTGHCLAAAGVVELVATLMTVNQNQIAPTIHLEEKAEECQDAQYNTFALDKEVHYAISNSFAFAGNTASILVGAYHEGE